MEYRVVWSPETVEDLESIAEYIERDSLFYSRAVVSKILKVSRKIKEFPLIGRVVPEIGDVNIRERFIYSYQLSPYIPIKKQ
ncbi:MAG: type II toxin-antitoxin system RelE/ParE family toxin [Desulfobacterales bacterium]|nr:type II toxin-antitoxin system RelE/ParE family toxin [Desulfobacterales bacterium]